MEQQQQTVQRLSKNRIAQQFVKKTTRPMFTQINNLHFESTTKEQQQTCLKQLALLTKEVFSNSKQAKM